MLFIDSNIWLRLYEPSGALRNLPEVIASIAGQCFVTAQVVDEVARNRVSVVADLYRSYAAQLSIKLPKLPVHLYHQDPNLATTWNEQASKVRDDHSELNSSFVIARTQALDAVRAGTDPVSEALAPVFLRATTANAAAMAKARARKETGNPPGKPKDPLGDQVSWEQILEHLRTHRPSRCWLVSADEDYFVPNAADDARQLNPLLAREVAQASPKTTVDCFDDLTTCLKRLKADPASLAKAIEPVAEQVTVLDITPIPPLSGTVDSTAIVTGAFSHFASGVTGRVPQLCVKCGSSLYGVVQGSPGRESWDLSCARCNWRTQGM